MANRLDLFFRAHTIPLKIKEKGNWKGGSHKQSKQALIFRCMTTTDEKQEFLMGAYICAELEGARFVAKEIGLFGRESQPTELRVLTRFARDSNFELGTIDQFRRQVFLKYLKAEGLIVAYDAPFEISRIAIKWNKSLKHRRAFSFYFRLFKDKYGKVRPSGYEPGLSIESLDASKANYRLIKYHFYQADAEHEREREAEQPSDAHIIDLKTLTAVLTGEAYTFSSACEIFGAPTSRSRKARSRITKQAIEQLLRDVTGELELLNRLKEEFHQHPLDLPLQRYYSPATLAKAYLSEMGIKQPKDKLNISDNLNGIALQAFFAGRAECTIRRTIVPITYVDFHSQFPAVSKLLGCREILCAERLQVRDITSEAREITERTTLADCFQPEFWKKLRWFAFVEANDDVVPMRAKFSQREGRDPTLAWNYLTCRQPFWLTGPDVIAAKLLTGKSLKIQKAIEIIPHGLQAGVHPVSLLRQVQMDPTNDDLASKLIDLRTSMKAEKPKLASGLKVAANSAAFGVFCQLNVKDLDSPTPLQVFSGETNYLTPPDKVWEEPADFFCPIIASLVTGGSHLLCAMVERTVRDLGGHIAAMDTDSAMIVSTKDGGFVPCAGGPQRLEQHHAGSGHAAIRALSFAEVDSIRERFETLNPWRDGLSTPFLRLEEENFASDGKRQPLYALCVSAKLYCLFNLEEDRLVVRKPSGHGLGFLQPPYSIAQWQRRTGRKWAEALSPWVHEAWHFLLSQELGLPHQPNRWLKQPSIMTVPLTTPQVFNRLGIFENVFRPFTVVTVPFPNKEINQLWTGFFIMPYTEKLNDLHGRPMINVVSGGTFYIHDRSSSTSAKSPGWLSLKTMQEEIEQLLSRTESKFCTPNGSTCTSATTGLLVRRHVTAGEFHFGGKETSTRWRSGPDLSMMTEAGLLDAGDETFREYERVVDPKYLDEIRTAAKEFSTKLLSRKAALAECAIRNFKRGKNSIRPRSLRKLIRTIHDLQNKTMKS